MRRIRFLPLVIAVFAIIAPAFVTYANANALTNGTFALNGGGWSGANGGNNCSSGSPSIGGWAANRLSLSYVQNTVSQSVIIQQPSELTLSISVHFPWGGQYLISIQDDNQTSSTGLININSWNSPSASHSLSVNTTKPSEVVTVSISGKDNMFWAGCYGPQFSNAELTASPTAPATTTTTIPENLVWIELNEGWSGEITAPSGVFSSVLFASYGNPEGSNGSYTLGWCHAQNSLSIIEGLLIGNQSAVLNSSNGVFGDPCGGTYKRLYVAAVYTPVPTTTTSTTTTTTTTTVPETTTTIQETTTTEEQTTTTEKQTTTTEEETTTTQLPENDSTTTTEMVTTTTVKEIESPDTGTTVPTPDETLPEQTEPETQLQDTTSTSYDLPLNETSKNDESVDTTAVIDVTDSTNPEEITASTTVTDATEINSNEIADIDVESMSNDELSSAVEDAISSTNSPEELGKVINEILDKPLDDEQFTAVIDEIFSKKLNSEELAVVLDAVFDEPLSDEKFIEVISAVISQNLDKEQFSKLIDVLGGETVSEEQVVAAVDQIIEIGLTEDQATEIATSPEVLSAVTGDQAAEIFDQVPVSELTPEEAAQIVEAVQDAPKEVRSAFEEQINVFEGNFDTYTPIGSTVDVGTRRVVVAASAAMFAAPATSGSSSGGSGNSERSRRR